MYTLDINYKVDEKKRVVVAYATICWDKELSKVESYIEDRNCDVYLWRLNFNRPESETFVGKARCSEEDTFDVEYGKALARARLCKKVDRAWYSFFGYVDDIIHSVLTKFNTLRRKDMETLVREEDRREEELTLWEF